MKKLSEINVIRAIACVFVVLTHSISSYLNNVEVNLMSEDKYIIWIRFAILCATPIFILLSETLISKNYPVALPKGFFRKRFKYILIPYILIGSIVSYMDSEGNFESFINLVIEKVLLGDWYGFFVIVIFQLYILHWLLGNFLSKVNPIYPLVISFLISFTHVYLFVNITEYKEFIFNYYPLSFRTNIFIWLFYFVVAFYTGQYYERILSFLSNKVWIPVLSTVISYLVVMHNILSRDYTTVASERYDMMLYSVSVFFLMLIIFRKYSVSNKTLITISHFSYFIYLTHMLTLPYYAELTLRFGSNFFIYIIVMAFLTISTSIGWAFLFYNNKFTRLFTGRIIFMEKKM